MTVLEFLGMCLFLSAVSQTRVCSDSSIDTDHNVLEHKWRMIAGDLRKAMKNMKIGMNSVERVSRNLNYLCEELHPDDETSIEMTEPQCDNVTEEGGLTSPIHLTSVMTTNSSFDLEYTATCQPETNAVDYGVLDVSFHNVELSNSFSRGSGLLRGSTLSRFFKVILRVDNYSSYIDLLPTKDMNVTLPTLDLVADVHDEIVFEPGTSTQVKVKVNKKTGDIYRRSFSYGMRVVDRNNTETVIDTMRKYPGIIDRLGVDEHETYDEHTVVINGNQEDYEGIVRFRLHSYQMDHHSSVSSISLYLALNVRRSDHMAPFPEGFLGFLLQHKNEYNRKCEAHKVCFLYCSIVGQDPDTVSLWRFIDERRERMTFQRKKNHYVKNTVEVHFKIRNTTKADAGIYMYRGTSYSGRVIEKEFEVLVFVPYTIVEEKSQVLKDTRDQLVVRCVGRGYPDPDIRFSQSKFYSKDAEITEGPGILMETYTNSDEIISTTLTVDKTLRSIKKIYCIIKRVDHEYQIDWFKIYGKFGW